MRVTLSRVLMAGLAVGCVGSAAMGQWSTNPAANLTLADMANDQVQPKIRATPDGGCYVSWFDNRPAATTCTCSGSTRPVWSNGSTTGF
jgi:hypothetical protein